MRWFSAVLLSLNIILFINGYTNHTVKRTVVVLHTIIVKNQIDAVLSLLVRTYLPAEDVSEWFSSNRSCHTPTLTLTSTELLVTFKSTGVGVMLALSRRLPLP